MAGNFVRFYLPFEVHGNFVSAQDQALAILTEAQKHLEKGCTGVAITYSANYDQTQKINATYQQGQWNTRTHGANQAQAMSALEKFLGNEFMQLQHKIRIAPITTLTYTTFGTMSHADVVKEDLQNIKHLLETNWTVLGWINQVSKPHFAVGGGIAQIPQSVSTYIQKTLEEYAMQYSHRQDL